MTLNFDVIEAVQREMDFKPYIHRQAVETDFSRLITKSTVVTVDGEPRMVYVDLDEMGEDCTGIVQYLHTVNFKVIKQKRASGMAGTARIVGWMPRRAIKTDYCHIATLASENPPAHAAIVGYAQRAALWYQKFNPALYSQHQGMTEELIKPDYQLPETVFTSGIVNRDNAIPYHFDAGNFKDVWSCMLGFKRDVEGGYLSAPEFDMGFEIKNNSLFMFDGQGILHGVTPFKKKNRKAYRYTIVYYSLQKIWQCLPVTEEVARIRAKKTQREQLRAKVVGGEITPEQAWPDAAKRLNKSKGEKK